MTRPRAAERRRLTPVPDRRPRSLLRRVFWLPPASLVAVELYVRGFDGWGAWASAPLFLLPLVLALAFAAAGGWALLAEVRGGGIRGATLVLTAVAASPLVWIALRRYLVS